MRGERITWKTILDSFHAIDRDERESLLSALAQREKAKRVLKNMVSGKSSRK